MNFDRYLHTDRDAWRWRQPTGADITPMVELVREHFQREATSIFRTDELLFTQELTLAVVRQFYNPSAEMLFVAESADHKLMAYNWIYRGQYMPYSRDEMAGARMMHIDLNLSQRQRMRLAVQTLLQWETWAKLNGIPVICSSTMREDQGGFLRLHAEMGYDCRGSICYKRVIK